jgi:uncharacterized membrane protein
MSDNGNAALRGGAPRWMKITLVLSLALNLLVAGVVGGAMLRHGMRPGDPHPSARAHLGRAYVQALERGDRRALWSAMQAEQPDAAAPGADPDAVLRALRATPYDPAALRDIMVRQRQAGQARLRRGQRLLQERLTEMSDAERAAYADRLEGLVEGQRSGARHAR